jgi:hypothetical protein
VRSGAIPDAGTTNARGGGATAHSVKRSSILGLAAFQERDRADDALPPTSITGSAAHGAQPRRHA